MKKLVTKEEAEKMGVRGFYKTAPTLWLKCQILCVKLSISTIYSNIFTWKQ